MKKIISILSTSLLLFGIACSSDSNEDTTPNNDNTETKDTNDDQPEASNSKPNILLIIADDMGIDVTPGYNLGSQKPNMPTVSGLMNDGVKYTNVWSAPVCTPTRGAMITGKYGFKTGITKVDHPLSLSETTLQKFVRDRSDYETAVIGKWHLSKDATHPNSSGVGYYAGSLSGGLRDYSSWTLNTNGVETTESSYVTSKYTDLAINWIKDQDKPWFLWLAHNAPHTPFHLPPADLHDRGDLPSDQASIDANPQPYYFAMLEAMDTEIGRLLESMDAATRSNTLIIFVGDNGTPGGVAQEYNSRRAKGSIYQGGVNVPMVVSGANVSRKNVTDESLIGTVDIFATVAEIALENNKNVNDSKSFRSTFSGENTNAREFVFTEEGLDTGGLDRTIRNATHKYMLFDNGTERLHNLVIDPLEETNLVNANRLPLSTEDQTVYDELKEALNTILDN